MVLSPQQIIAAINPKYSSNPNEVTRALKTEGFEEAAKTAKPQPVREYKLIYDSSAESLEPVYFWILDFLGGLGLKVEKLVDNFTSSPGSGHFSELMMKATKMQEEAMKIYGTVNTVIKSVLNLLYDLKEFQLRLSSYDNFHSKDKEKRESGLTSLKQIWMDQVDIKKGRGSINMLAQDLNFVTLRDAFMVVKDEKLEFQGHEIDLSDRVKRILRARISEFLEWVGRSEKELRKRFEIEKTYLKTQVNAIQLYSRWAKPYLRAAQELEQNNSSDPGLVHAFNTILFELSILGTKAFDLEQAAVNKTVPMDFKRIKLKRKYFSCVMIDFKFRGIPQRAGQHYSFGGRSEVVFRSYCLNEEEYALFKDKLNDDDLKSAMGFVEGMTTESLDKIKEDIDEFLEDKQEETKKSTDDINPFSALFGLDNKKEKKKKKKGEKIKSPLEIKKDSYVESMVRTETEQAAKKSCYTVYDIYKKGHGMASTAEEV